MATRPRGLLEQIEKDLQNERPVASTLRKIILFGGQVGSAELRDWAGQELRGYGRDDELPAYRVVPAPIQMDGAIPGGIVRGQRVGVSELPDFAQADIDEHVELRQGVGEIEQLILRGDEHHIVKLSLPGARELARYMQYEAGGGVHIDSLYWSVSTVAIAGVVDQVRTRLAQLLAELRAVSPSNGSLPSPAQTDRAFNIVMNGRNASLTLNSILAGDDSSNQITIAPADHEQPHGFWTTSRRVGAAAVGLATIVGTGIALLPLLP